MCIDRTLTPLHTELTLIRCWIVLIFPKHCLLLNMFSFYFQISTAESVQDLNCFNGFFSITRKIKSYFRWLFPIIFLPLPPYDGQHYSDVMMSTMATQIPGVLIVYSIVCSDPDKAIQSSASLVFVMGIHWWPVNSPHKGPVAWKMFPFDDVIMKHSDVMHRDGVT